MEITRVYVAGPYCGHSLEERDQNVSLADETARRVMLAGFNPYCPHLATYAWEEDPRFGEPGIARRTFMENCLHWLSFCDAILVLPGWENSEGTKEELNFAKSHGIKIFYSLEDLRAAA